MPAIADALRGIARETVVVGPDEESQAWALAAAGARTVDAVITHALFAPEMIADFKRAGIGSIRSTSSVPHPTNAIALDGILAAALEKEFSA